MVVGSTFWVRQPCLRASSKTSERLNQKHRARICVPVSQQTLPLTSAAYGPTLGAP